MTPRLVGIDHVALQVDDLEEAVGFYTALFRPTAVDPTEEGAAFLEMGDHEERPCPSWDPNEYLDLFFDTGEELQRSNEA
jgi:catechol 2,3-dioxygenase-like lactoylglutathione lyase family enzyme